MIAIKTRHFVFIFNRFHLYVEKHVLEKNMNTAFKTNWSECFLRLVMISDHSNDIENGLIKCPDSDFKITLSRSNFEQSYNLILSCTMYLPMSPKEAYQCIQGKSRLC